MNLEGSKLVNETSSPKLSLVRGGPVWVLEKCRAAFHGGRRDGQNIISIGAWADMSVYLEGSPRRDYLQAFLGTHEEPAQIPEEVRVYNYDLRFKDGRRTVNIVERIGRVYKVSLYERVEGGFTVGLSPEGINVEPYDPEPMELLLPRLRRELT